MTFHELDQRIDRSLARNELRENLPYLIEMHKRLYAPGRRKVTGIPSWIQYVRSKRDKWDVDVRTIQRLLIGKTFSSQNATRRAWNAEVQKQTPVLTARVGNNAELFAEIVRLYVPEKADIIDATWGLGNFWSVIDQSKYNLISNDLYTNADMHADFRNLPLPNESQDVYVLDPPYAQHGTPMKPSISKGYGTDFRGPTSEKEMIEWYRAGAREAHRLLRREGLLILKTQDAVESGKQVWKSDILKYLEGFTCIDQFILVQRSEPARRWAHQKHARKNHSVFLVHQKR